MKKGTSRGLGVFTVLALVGMGLMFLGVVLDEGRQFDNPTPVIVAIAGACIFAGLFIGPVGRALAKMLEGDTQADEESTMRLEDVEARLAELSLEQQRVTELEDRLDFAERMLAQPNAATLRRGDEG